MKYNLLTLGKAGEKAETGSSFIFWLPEGIDGAAPACYILGIHRGGMDVLKGCFCS